jgi:L-ascorbate metabolism protein UlaG (beta-lactamase superfamily)
VSTASPSRRTLLLTAVRAIAPALAASGCASNPATPPSLAPVVQQQPSSDGMVTARFLGTTSILFRDDKTTILSDGFLTRPVRHDVFLGEIRPNEERIVSTLRRLGVEKVDALFTGHSHYDHALDAPTIAKLKGAVLLGSESTRQLGLGGELPKDRIFVVHHGETREFGRFALTFFESKHSSPELWPGRIRRPVVPPAPARNWKTGGAWSVKIAHEKRTLLVHGSANYRGDALSGQRVEVVYLGIGGLGLRSDGFVRKYWKEVVQATGAKRVILVHWDDFFGVEEPLRAAPGFENAVNRIRQHAWIDGVEVVLPVLWESTNPFQGLACGRV